MYVCTLPICRSLKISIAFEPIKEVYPSPPSSPASSNGQKVATCNRLSILKKSNTSRSNTFLFYRYSISLWDGGNRTRNVAVYTWRLNINLFTGMIAIKAKPIVSVFALVQYLYCNGMRPSLLASGTCIRLTSLYLASAQYRYCSGYSPLFVHVRFPHLSG